MAAAPVSPPPIVRAMLRPTAPPPLPYGMPSAAPPMVAAGPPKPVPASSVAPTPTPSAAPAPAPAPSGRPWVWIGLGIALGLVLLAIGLVIALGRNRHTALVTARLSGVSCATGICVADVTFEDLRGKKHVVRGHRVSGTYHNGQEVLIFYNPENPQDIAFRFMPLETRLAIGWSLVAAGVVLMGWAGWTAFFRARGTA